MLKTEKGEIIYEYKDINKKLIDKITKKHLFNLT